MINYVPLHVHTDKSLMDGCATVDEYGDRALALGMTSMAITDHGTMSNHREFNRAMRERGIKPIFGIEAYVTPDIKDRRDRKSRKEPLDRIYNHLTILAKNEAGYKNLSKLSNIAWTDGYFHKPRMDFDMLDEYRDGLILSSACMGGLINSAIEIGDFATAKKNLGLLRDIAGDDFYVEVMPHNTEGINAALIEMSDAYGIKTIVTPDCHHAHKGQKVIQEIMLIANTHPDRLTVDQVQEQRDSLKARGRLPDYSELDDADRKHLMMLDEIYGPDRRMTFNKFDIHLLSGQEMWNQMGDSAREDAFLNTFEVDEKVETFEMAKDMHLLPELAEDPDAELARLVDRGLKQLGVNNATYRSRAKEELEIIRDKQFAPYFLVVADAINWAMSQGIRVGPGRGSGVGSLVNYAIGNTHVDPVAHGLLFSRFIDPSRPDWPDIDVDIEKSRREEVKAYVANKYVHVAGIATYQKFQDKGMIKDIARVFNVPLAEVNKVNKLIEFWDEFKDSPSVKKFRDEYKFIEIYGDQLRGRTRGTGVHASGMVTSIIPIAEVAPIETRAPANRDRVPVVAVDMEETADVGLIKLDFLGLKTLSILSDTVELIKQRTGKYIDLEDLDRADPNVYNMLSSGHTMGVFQCEQAPYTKLLVQMGVSSFDELAATNALVRPGAAKTIGKEYISRKQGKRKVVYVHKDVESFTSETYGLPIYQEQIMQLCTELAGMTMVEANAVRRITSKKKDASALEPYRLKFVAGAAEKIGIERAELLWEDILKWSGYGFNKCTTGDTIVRRPGSNGQEGPDITVRELYERFHSNTNTGKKYRGKIGVKIFGMDADGRARAHRVKDVYKNGVKPVYKVTTEDGHFIRATSNHKHWTSDGYMSIEDGLSVGQHMSICDFVYDKEHRIDADPRLNGLGSGWAKATEIRAEASDGRMRPALDGSSAEYRSAVSLLDKTQADCGHETDRAEIAHLDSNPRNNSVDNLAVLCNSCHKRLDYMTGSRKVRGSKGYPVRLSKIVSIDYDGEEETFDIEMDSEEHNFFANGILTHNSHAVAYSYISYWTAWLKYYYPLEFITSVLKNEEDKTARTQYLIEAKRLGLDVLLPHVNKSDVDFSIEGDSIRIGLSSIKYVSHLLAERYIAKRPFSSYKEILEFTVTKGSGVNTRALGAMNAVGALHFEDNPLVPSEVKGNLYEYLNLPELSVAIPAHWPAFMTTADDFDDVGAHVMMGTVTNIRRGKGWSLVSMMDKTGTVGFFDSENSLLEKGRSYLFLIGSNRVVEFVPIEEIDSSESGIIKWLNLTDDPCAQEEIFVMSFLPRVTKKGDRMGTLIGSTSERELVSMVVFPRQFPVAFAKMTPGTTHRVTCKEGNDGGLILERVE